MALMDCSFYSHELGMDVQFQVVIPESRVLPVTPGKKKYKALYCLHGHSRDYSTFLRYGCLEQILADSNVIAIIPNGHRSFYMNELHGYRYFSYVTEELPTIVENMLPVSSLAKERFLCGFSMGGYGALRAALLLPHRYAGAAVFSVASDPFECMDILHNLKLSGVPDLQENMTRIFGTREEFCNSDSNLEVAVHQACAGTQRPYIYHACGKQDILYGMNQRLRAILETSYPRQRYTYNEYDGCHNWDFWNNELKKILNIFRLA
jgi:S-formylglutathione hydrolase FrmB